MTGFGSPDRDPGVRDLARNEVKWKVRYFVQISTKCHQANFELISRLITIGFLKRFSL